MLSNSIICMYSLIDYMYISSMVAVPYICVHMRVSVSNTKQSRLNKNLIGSFDENLQIRPKIQYRLQTFLKSFLIESQSHRNSISVGQSACLRHVSVEGPGFESCYCLLTAGPQGHRCAPTCLQTESNTGAKLAVLPLKHHYLAAQSSGQVCDQPCDF